MRIVEAFKRLAQIIENISAVAYFRGHQFNSSIPAASTNFSFSFSWLAIAGGILVANPGAEDQ